MRAPTWARGEAPTIEEEALAKAGEAVAAERAKVGTVGDLPVSRERASFELSEGQRALRSTRPRNKRWRELGKLDDAIDKLQQRQAEAVARLQEAEQALQQAPGHDARTLAQWLEGGEKGARPEATVYERQRGVDAARLLIAAVSVELDAAIERRAEHVERNREKMLDDARKDVDDARTRLLEHVHALPGLRDAVRDARETLVWTATFPGQAESYGFPNALALGLRAPVERHLGTAARIDYAAVIAALEEDAAALATKLGPQATQALGIDEPVTPEQAAMWDSDPRHKQWAKEQLERARGLAEYQNPDQLAAEIRDLRP